MKQIFKQARGKTVKSIAAERDEASDGCEFVTVEIRFTDGSMVSMQLRAQPVVDGVFFKDDNDDRAKETRIL